MPPTLPPSVQSDVDKVQGRIAQSVEGPWYRLVVQYEMLDLAGLRAELAGLEAELLADKTDEELLVWAKGMIRQLSAAKRNTLSQRKAEVERAFRAMGKM
jgi:hypothetical protein